MDFDSEGPEADVEEYWERIVCFSKGLCTADTTASSPSNNSVTISQGGFLLAVAGNLGITN